MPLVTAAVLAYAAGLLSGFGGAFVWTALAALLVIWQGARSSRERLALAALATAGFAIAETSRRAESACLARLAAAREWDVRLASDAAPGEFVFARHECGTHVRLSVEKKGRATAGALVRVRGEPVLARGRGTLLVTRAHVRELRGPARRGRRLPARWPPSAPRCRSRSSGQRAWRRPSARRAATQRAASPGCRSLR